ncbi:uncharacterized protein LOC131025855 [Salvia miltiorrhiza]|uniref:uncharacterized protein LOC131025855 n=1 Tax=Salvia miltiorrhiza TaxID=226208 RepID=UPI0025ACEA27|nr:uncharacterized protein LOC131025855 [Salvia miltiorrhiza]
MANAINNLHQSGKFSSNIAVSSRAASEGSHGFGEMGNELKKNHEDSLKMPMEEISPPAFDQEIVKVVVEAVEKKDDDGTKVISHAAVPTSFLQRHKKEGKGKFSKFLEIFKKVHINLPLVEALLEMPQYAKYLRDVVSRKKKLGEFETINLNEECSAILQRKLLVKIKDPGSFTIACMIGDQHFGKALCDLGTSINLMPLSIFKKLAIGELKPTSMVLQMADRSVTYPRGIEVGDFIFPADFVVLDIEDDKNIPLILGCPFLATGRPMINVEKGELTLRVNEESQIFSIYRPARSYEDEVPKQAKDPGKRRADDLNIFNENYFSWQGPAKQTSQGKDVMRKYGAERGRSQHCMYQPP